MTANEVRSRRCAAAAGMTIRALLAAGAGAVALGALQLGDFTPVPSAWGLVIPVIAGVSVGMARMTVHEALGCTAVVLATSPLLATLMITLPASFLEGAGVAQAALKGAFVADAVFLLPCFLGGILLGRWACGLSHYRAQPATWKR